MYLHIMRIFANTCTVSSRYTYTCTETFADMIFAYTFTYE